MNAKAILFSACLSALASSSAMAHHSFAMFANGEVQTLEGTVTEFEWINPHAWIHLLVKNSAGKPEEWAFEMGGTGQLAARGWSKSSASPGDRVTVTFHPMRDGSHGGSGMSVKLPNGKVLGGGPGPAGRGGRDGSPD